MESQPVPDSNKTLDRIESLPTVIRQAIEAGIQEAREFFDRLDESIEPYLFANITRYRARQYLKEHSQALIEFAQEELNNNGIGLIFAGCYLRVWKAVHRYGEKVGKVPAAGYSHARQGFLSQHIQLPLFLGESVFDDALPTVDLNLIVLWDTDRKHNLSEMRLVMPEHGSVLSTSVYWDIVIPNPILSMTASASSEQDVGSDDLDDIIGLPDEQESAEGQSE